MSERAGRVVLVAAACAALVAAACGRRTPGPAPATWVGGYQGDTVRSEDGISRVAVLDLRADSTGMMAYQFLGRGQVLRYGRWAARGDEVTFQPLRAGQDTVELPLVWRDSAGRLLPLQWDRHIYGDSGLRMTRLKAPDAAPATAPADTGAGGKR